MPSLDALPPELLHNIYAHLDGPKAWYACSMTCKSMSLAAKSSPKWVYRALLCATYDDGADYEARTYPWLEELRCRSRLGLQNLEQPPALTYRDLQAVETLFFTADMIRSIGYGKNLDFLWWCQIFRIIDHDFEESEIARQWDAPMRELYYKVGFLILTNPLATESTWEARQNSHQFILFEPELQIPQNLFRPEGTFDQKVSRVSKTNDSAGDIICDIPPLDFAGSQSLSTPNWRVMFACMKLMLHVKHGIGRGDNILLQNVDRPYALLHSGTSNDTCVDQFSWTGYYVYIDYDVYQSLMTGQGIDWFPSLYSDGLQDCHFTLHADGSVTGAGHGAPMRRGASTGFTLTGVWTSVAGCPKGFKRVAFHKHYEDEDPHEPTRWLYDGLIVRGLNGGLFIGRWKDDTQQFEDEIAVQGPFIFWSKRDDSPLVL